MERKQLSSIPVYSQRPDQTRAAIVCYAHTFSNGQGVHKQAWLHFPQLVSIVGELLIIVHAVDFCVMGQFRDTVPHVGNGDFVHVSSNDNGSCELPHMCSIHLRAE